MEQLDFEQGFGYGTYRLTTKQPIQPINYGTPTQSIMVSGKSADQLLADLTN